MKKVILIITMVVLGLHVFAGSDIELNISEGKYWNHKIDIVPVLFYKKATPQIAVWCEDMNGNLIETVYISGKISDFIKKGERIEALPVWRTKYLKNEASKVDGVGGATQTKGVMCSTAMKCVLPESFRVVAEINNSFDYNEYYTKDGAKGTEKSGVNGQPSLIYMKEMANNEKSNVKLELYGCGSLTGKDGEIYKDLSKITTAKEIAQSINIQIK